MPYLNEIQIRIESNVEHLSDHSYCHSLLNKENKQMRDD